MNRINFLPPWVETNLQPAFYDKESGSCLQQTARMYAKVNQLVRIANEQYATIAEYIAKFIQLKDFVEDYFENLDVQEEINNKLDQMAEDGIIGAMLDHYFDVIREDMADYETSVNGQLATFQSVINKFNNNPVAVADISDMTDHNQIYVLTTDGKWYYYDSDSSAFVAGGDYQSTQLIGLDDEDMANKGLTTKAISFYTGYNLRTDYVNQRYGWVQEKLQFTNNGNITATNNSNDKCVTSYIPANSFVRIVKSNTSGRFRVGALVNRPQNGGTATIIYENNDASDFCFFNTSNNWLIVFFSHASDPADAGTTIDVYVDNRNTILDAIRPENLTICETVDSDNLFDPYNMITSYGCQPSSAYYRWSYNQNYRSYILTLKPNTDYHIEKIGTSDRFRVCLWRAEPKASDEYTGQGVLNATPSVVVIDDDDETECDFNSSDYLYCTISYTNSKQSGVTFNITTPNAGTASYERIKKEYLKDYMITKVDGGYQFLDEANADSDFWSMWGGRLSYGMTPTTAYVPAYFNSQIFVDGTIMCHNTDSKNNNRWQHHLFDGYSKDQYSRMSLTVDFVEEYDKKHGDWYYYTGEGSGAAAYGYVKVGSDTTRHSCKFDRDEMVADAQITCHNPFTLANISPDSDCIFTYNTYAEADTAYYPTSIENIKAVKGIQMKNAQNGTMFYDSDRDKVVVKIGGEWCDLQTTPVPSGTYDF